MWTKDLKPFLIYISANILACHSCLCNAEVLSKHLSVTTSANSQSNKVQSFVIVKGSKPIIQGIKHNANYLPIGRQIPFVIDYTKSIEKHQALQWHIKVSDKQHGTINLLSGFKGKGRILKSGYEWKSEILDAGIKDRQRLVFRPKPYPHAPGIYKKGKGPKGKRSKYGGGTRNINVKKYNPKFAYDITLNILPSSSNLSSSAQASPAIKTHKASLEMDRKDMIRQEYINHYNIKRYGRGNNGSIPIPTRDEISSIPPNPEQLEGNPLTESKYKLIVNDGMVELGTKINRYYLQQLKELKSSGEFLNLNQQKLNIPEIKLWVSSGWRNPERNEWYSHAVNGIHQRGGAVDFIIIAPPGSQESSIGYWVLWLALEKHKTDIKAFWQLETNGRPMTTNEYTQDIEPLNGIPDAFDKADHLHANVNY